MQVSLVLLGTIVEEASPIPMRLFNTRGKIGTSSEIIFPYHFARVEPPSNYLFMFNLMQKIEILLKKCSSAHILRDFFF